MQKIQKNEKRSQIYIFFYYDSLKTNHMNSLAAYIDIININGFCGKWGIWLRMQKNISKPTFQRMNMNYRFCWPSFIWIRNMEEKATMGKRNKWKQKQKKNKCCFCFAIIIGWKNKLLLFDVFHKQEIEKWSKIFTNIMCILFDF